MIKVLHFVSTPSIASGVMSVIMNYYRHMDRSKVQFDFLCFIPCEDSYEKEIKELGGQVFFIPKPGTSLNSISEIWKFFSNHKLEYQWFHNHEVYLSFFLKPLSKICKIPHFIIHCHATKFSDKKVAAFRNFVLCTPIRFVSCAKFACSAAAGQFLFGTSAMQTGKVHILHNGIELKRYVYNEQVREKIRLEYNLKDCFLIGHVGRFNNQKNHVFLIEMFALLSEKNPNVRLFLIGDGPLKEEIKKRCYELHIENKVLFLGQRVDVENFYSAMDIFVLPSLYEGIGIALLEAQVNGLYCLASDQVPIEAKLLENVEFLSLHKEKWINKIQKIQQNIIDYKRPNNNDIIRNFSCKHYNIEIESCWLQKYYENTNIDVHI